MDERDNVKTNSDASLGIFSVVALILMLWGYCWLKSYSSFRIPQMINVIFHEVAGLNENAAVYLDGVRVGMVTKMEWQASHQVLVRLRINNAHVEVPRGSKFDILTNGIVGAKYVEIILPEIPAGQQPPPPITSSEEVLGEDPVRPELAVNKLAIGLGNIDLDKLGKNFEADRKRLVLAADQLALLANKVMPLVDKTGPLEAHLDILTQDLTKTTGRINRIMNNPHFSGDLKETAQQARQTVESLRATMHELDTTLGDKPMRQDILSTMQQLKATSENIQSACETVRKIGDDKGLRSDLKEILVQVHQDLDEVNNVLNNKNYSTDLHSTLSNARSALGDLDLVARQLNQVLNKKQPLLRLMFGRPGFIKNTQAEIKVKAHRKDDTTNKDGMTNRDATTDKDAVTKKGATTNKNGLTDKDGTTNKDSTGITDRAQTTQGADN